MNPETITAGTIVTYEDMANPLESFEVVAVNDNPWSTFELRSIETGEVRFTDGRQNGWKVAPVCSCPRPMPADDGECQRCFGFVR